MKIRVTGQDVAQEMDGNWATAELMAWPGTACLLLSFSPFPVRHPVLSPCRSKSEGFHDSSINLLNLDQGIQYFRMIDGYTQNYSFFQNPQSKIASEKWPSHRRVAASHLKGRRERGYWWWIWKPLFFWQICIPNSEWVNNFCSVDAGYCATL